MGKDTIQTPEVSTSKLGIQGWKLLFTVLSPAKWSLVLALIFTFLTVFMNVGLLTVSAWLLASAALQPGLTYLSLAIVGVRFFGVSRAVCRYFERYTSHRMAFQGLYGLRVWFYAHLEPLAPAILKRFWCRGYARPHYGGYRGTTIFLFAYVDSACSSHCFNYFSCLWCVYD